MRWIGTIVAVGCAFIFVSAGLALIGIGGVAGGLVAEAAAVTMFVFLYLKRSRMLRRRQAASSATHVSATVRTTIGPINGKTSNAELTVSPSGVTVRRSRFLCGLTDREPDLHDLSKALNIAVFPKPIFGVAAIVPVVEGDRYALVSIFRDDLRTLTDAAELSGFLVDSWLLPRSYLFRIAGVDSSFRDHGVIGTYAVAD